MWAATPPVRRGARLVGASFLFSLWNQKLVAIFIAIILFIAIY